MISAFIYLLAFAIVFALNIVAERTRSSKKRTALIIASAAVLVLLIGLRFNVGTDYKTYLEEYEKIRLMPWGEAFSHRMEPLIVVLYKSFSCVLAWFPYWIFFLYGLMSVLPLYLSCRVLKYKNMAYIVLAYCLVFLPFVLNGMRQGVALSFVLLSTALLIKRTKITQPIVALAIALFFHLSAAIMIPFMAAYMICEKKKKNYSFFSLVLATLLIVGIFTLQNVGIYSGYLSHASITNLSFKSLLAYSPAIVIAIICCKELSREKVANNNDRLLPSHVLCGAILQVIGTIAPYVNRLSLYFMPSFIILVPTFIISTKDKKERIAAMALYVLYLLAFFIVEFVIWGRNEIIPYSTWIFI